MVDRTADRTRLSPQSFEQVAYLLRMLERRAWFPAVSEGAVRLLRVCGSQLERMYFLGLIYHLDQERQIRGHGPQPVSLAGSARWDIEQPWYGFTQDGPTAMHIRPQLPRSGLLYDFGIYFDGRLAMAVEVDGYNVHRRQRPWDERKARKLRIPVVRLYEETDNPLRWAESILDWTGTPCTHCGEHITREHSCPPF